MSVIGICIFLVGRLLHCIPAVLGIAIIFVLLAPMRQETTLLFAIVGCLAVPLSAVLTTVFVGKILEVKLPSSLHAAVSAATFLLLLNTETMFSFFAMLPASELSFAAFAQFSAQVVTCSVSVCLLFFILLLLIEAPIVLLFSANGVHSPAVLKAGRPLVALLLLSISLQHISDFLLAELGNPVW